jgi:hypothetical protein
MEREMTSKCLTFKQAVQMLIEAKVVDSEMSVGTNNNQTEINIPAGGIDANSKGMFNRSDICKLIGYSRI